MKKLKFFLIFILAALLFFSIFYFFGEIMETTTIFIKSKRKEVKEDGNQMIVFSILDFFRKLFGGSISGLFQTVIFYPIIFLYTKKAMENNADSYFDTIKKLWKENGLKAFYKGMSISLLCAVLDRAIKLSFFQTLKPAIGFIFACFITGLFEGVIINPFQFARIRLIQTHETKRIRDLELIENDLSIKEIIKDLLNNEGVIAFFNWKTSILYALREFSFNMGNFLMYEWIRIFFFTLETNRNIIINKGIQSGIAGFFGGCSGVLFNTPFDVVSTRIQKKDNDKSILTIIKEGGLYNGIFAKFLKIGLSTSLMFIIYNFLTE